VVDAVHEPVLQRVVVSGDLLARRLFHPRNLLDIGCGPGTFGAYLGSRLGIREVHGVDFIPELVDEATRNGIHASVLDLDRQDVPYADGTFDAVFAGEVIEHLTDPDHLLAEAARVLAPGGAFVLSTPNLAGWMNRIALLAGWTPIFMDTGKREIYGRPGFMAAGGPRTPQGHLMVMTNRALHEMVEAHGFSVYGAVPVGLRGNMPDAELGRGSLLRRALLRPAIALDDLLSHRETLATGVVLGLARVATR